MSIFALAEDERRERIEKEGIEKVELADFVEETQRRFKQWAHEVANRMWKGGYAPEEEMKLAKPRSPWGGWLQGAISLDGVLLKNSAEGLVVIASIAPEEDGRWWLHVSASTTGRKVPTWRQMGLIKKLFIGPDAEAYSVFPPKDRHVNIGEVLHLWHCLDAPDGGVVLPRFERTATFALNGVRGATPGIKFLTV